ncbi:MAG: site-2 protease family protein [Anaerolineae bacterium]|nr:site-2 protease family protein [Anaerolineae bacterium]
MLLYLGTLSSLPPDLFVAAVVGIVAALLIGMTVHEWAHNYVAHLMGDPNPRRLGRLTLNPLVHIYWPGFIMVLLIGFGVLGTAPISPYRMRNPRYGYLAAVAAGPVSNLGVAIVAALILNLLGGQREIFGAIGGFMGVTPLTYLGFALYFVITFNILLFIFNLLPFAPLDGWSIVYTLLPPREAEWWARNQQNSQFVFFALIFIGFAIPQFSPLGLIINPPMDFIMQLLL